MEWGILDGHHYQPQSGRQNRQDVRQVLRDIVEIVPVPVSAEVTALDMQECSISA
jgi:hypothetical protein